MYYSNDSNSMNSLILHIEYLLLHHDCVIVPGLGAFIVTETPARLDVEKGVIVPPCRSIMFNQAVTTEDGLLTNSIVRKNGLSFEEARQVLFREVNYIKNELAANGRYSFGKIGTMMIGEENTLLFFPSDASDSLSIVPGLKEVDLKCTNYNRESFLQNTPKKRFFHSVWKIAAVVTVTIALAIASLIYPLPSDQREQKASVLPVEAIFNKPVSIPETDSLQAVTVPKVALPDSVNSEKQPDFYLIVATFTDAQEAKAYAEKYSTNDFPLMTISSKKVTRVSVASSVRKEELQQKLNSKEINSRFSNPWIWERI